MEETKIPKDVIADVEAIMDQSNMDAVEATAASIKENQKNKLCLVNANVISLKLKDGATELSQATIDLCMSQIKLKHTMIELNNGERLIIQAQYMMNEIFETGENGDINGVVMRLIDTSVLDDQNPNHKSHIDLINMGLSQVFQEIDNELKAESEKAEES